MLSQAGLVVGTPMYMSPEQADGQPPGPASDLYSLGVVAYEMLTGRPPFMGETPLALLRAHIDKPLPPPRALNPALPEARRGGPVHDPGEGPGPPISVGRGVRRGAPLGVRPGTACAARFGRRRRRATGRGTRAAIRGRRGRSQRGAAPAPNPAPTLTPHPRPAAPTDATVPRRAMPPPAPPRPGGRSRLDETRHQPRPLPSEPPDFPAARATSRAGMSWSGSAPGRRPARAWARSADRRLASGDPDAGRGGRRLRPRVRPVRRRARDRLGGPHRAAVARIRRYVLRSLVGHTHSANDVAFSPDGTLLVSSSVDKTLRVYRVTDGALLNTFVKHTDRVNTVAFSPDGETVASAGGDSVVVSGARKIGEIRMIPVPMSGIIAVAFFARRPVRGGGGQRRLIRLFRVADGGEILRLRGTPATRTSRSTSGVWRSPGRTPTSVR